MRQIYKKKNSFWVIVHHCISHPNPKYNYNNMNYIGKLQTKKKILLRLPKKICAKILYLMLRSKNYGQYDYCTFYNNDTKNNIRYIL